MPAGDVVKLQRPVVGLAFAGASLHVRQVVHDVAAGNHQHPALAEHPELPGQRVMFGCGPRCVHAQLHHRNVGCGKHGKQHRPGPMVDSPGGRIQPQRLRMALAYPMGDGTCSFWSARCRVMQIKQLLRKIAKIMNRAWFVHGGKPPAGARRLPVRRNTQHQLRARPALACSKHCAQRLPALKIRVTRQRIHWTAMADKQHRHRRLGLAQKRHGVQQGCNRNISHGQLPCLQ